MIRNKILALTSFLFFIVFNLKAQFSYNFNAATETYAHSSGPNLITIFSAGEDDSFINNINIGFPFSYGGCSQQTFDKIHISTNGFIALGDTLVNSIPVNGFENLVLPRNIIAPLWDNLKVSSNGKITTNLLGTPGNYIFEVEWQKMLWQNNANLPAISFKVRLYQQQGKIEFLYKDESGGLHSPSATVGLGRDNGANNYYTVNSAFTALSPRGVNLEVSSKPATNTKFTFNQVIPQLLAPSSSVTSPTCYGSTDGSITISLINEFTNPIYSWTPSLTNSPTATNLPAGVYTFHYSDDGGCKDSITVTLLERSPITLDLNFYDSLVCIGQVVSIVASASGGNNAFQFNWPDQYIFNNDSISIVVSSDTIINLNFTDFNADDNTYCSLTRSVNISVVTDLSVEILETGGTFCETSYDLINLYTSGGHENAPTTTQWLKRDTSQGSPWVSFAQDYTYIQVTDLGLGNWYIKAMATNACQSAYSDSIYVKIVSSNPIPFADTVYMCPGSSVTLDLTGLPNSSSFIYTSTSESNISITDNDSFTPSILSSGYTGTYALNISFYDSISTCWSYKQVYAKVDSGGFNLNIYPKINGSLFGGGKVFVFKQTSVGAYALIDSIASQSTGATAITNLDPNFQYLIGVSADRILYPNSVFTYAGDKHKWEDAWYATGSCGQSISKTINVINLNIPSGNNQISGNIICVTDTSGRRPGEPIRGIDIILEDRPGGNAIMRTQTDNNGFYSFNNIANGNYGLYLSLPGCGHLATYEFNLSGNLTKFDLDFFVDSINGTIDTTTLMEPIICDIQLNYSVNDGCQNTPVYFNNLSTQMSLKNYHFFWDFNNDAVIDGNQKGNFYQSFSTPGDYHTKLYVESIGNGNCKDTLDLLFTINPLPNLLTNTNNIETCLGVRNIVFATSADSYNWSPSFLIKVNNDSIVELNTDTAGVFSLILEETLGICSASKTIPVKINELPSVSLNLDIDSACSQGGPITLTGGIPAGGSYAGSGVTNDQLDPQASGVGLHEIHYWYTDQSTGCSNSSVDIFEVLLCTNFKELFNQNPVEAPNPFNQYISLINLKLNSIVRIFDFQGKLMFECESTNKELIIDTEGFPSGIYLLKIDEFSKTIIKQ